MFFLICTVLGYTFLFGLFIFCKTQNGLPSVICLVFQARAVLFFRNFNYQILFFFRLVFQFIVFQKRFDFPFFILFQQSQRFWICSNKCDLFQLFPNQIFKIVKMIYQIPMILLISERCVRDWLIIFPPFEQLLDIIRYFIIVKLVYVFFSYSQNLIFFIRCFMLKNFISFQ